MQENVLTILIADDDTDACEALASILTRKYPAIGIKTVRDGRAALDFFREYRPDIVITDIIMPEMNGIELARECRTLKQDTKLIVLTGLSDLNDIGTETLAEIGIDHRILKPVIFGNLFFAIDQAIADINRQSGPGA